MLPVFGGALLVAVVFVICDWSGRTLAHHYQDKLEVAAIFAIGGCVLLGLVLARGLPDAGGDWPEIGLALASGSGLFAGYLRSGGVR
jgi:hypothetical protein